ncbi:MAG: YbjN domain-containing protein [Rhodospirillaceae bacterium]
MRFVKVPCAIFAVALFAVMALGTGAASAQATSPAISKISAQEAKGLFRDLGYTSVEVDSDGDIIVNMQGMRVLVLVGSAKGTSIQMRFSMTGTEATMGKVNTWNKTKMYSRAYLDDNGDPVLEAEQDLAGGVSIERLKDFIKTYGVSLTAFLREVT